MDKLRVAIIGAGQIARKSHVMSYKAMTEVELVGVSDTNLEAAKRFAGEFGIPYYGESHRALLETCRPDAVSVCVPNKFHYSIVMDALAYGCHVMCEKPPAISSKEAAEMSLRAEEKGLILTYDFHFRHGTNVSLVKNKIAKGEFGDIYYAKATWLRRAGIPGWGVFTNKDIQGGGPLIDIGAHMLDLALYLLDYPEISYAAASMSDRIGKRNNSGFLGDWVPDQYTVEDGLFGMVYFKNGTCLQVETSFALNMKEKDKRNVELYGTSLGASLFPLELYTSQEQGYGNTGYPFLVDGDLHAAAIRNFVRACCGQEEILVTAKQGAYVQKVIQALYVSAERGVPVTFSEYNI